MNRHNDEDSQSPKGVCDSESCPSSPDVDNSLKVSHLSNKKTVNACNNDPSHQLQQVYDIISKAFSKDVESISDVSTVVRSFMSKLTKIQNQLKIAMDEKQELEGSLQEQFDQILLDTIEVENKEQSEEILKKKLRTYKKDLLRTRDSLASKEAENQSLNAQIQQLQLSLDEKTRMCSRLELELNSLRNQSGISAKPVMDHSDVENTAALFEDILSQQEDEISRLVRQREDITNLMYKCNNALCMTEEEFTKMNVTVKTLTAQISTQEEKINELKEVLPNLASAVEESLPHEIRALMPECVGDPYSYILGIVNELTANKSLPDKPVDEPEQVVNVVPTDKYVLLIKHLEDAMRFIQNIANGHDTLCTDLGPLASDSSVRTVLLTQCARIGRFIDENVLEIGIDNIPRSSSVFDPNTFKTPEALLEEFFRFATKEQVKESPLRELFAIFTAICETQKCLLNYLDRIKSDQPQMHRQMINNASCAQNEVLKKLQRENFDLSQWKAVNSDRLEQAYRALVEVTGDREASIDVMAYDLGNRCRLLSEKIVELEGKLDFTKSEFSSELARSREIQEELNRTIDNYKEELEKSKARHIKDRENLQNSIKQLSSEAAESRKKCDQTKTCLMTQLEEKTKKLKKTQQTHKQTKEYLDQIQEQIESLLSENKQLSVTNEDLKNSLAIQTEQVNALAQNEKKLRASRDKLKKRIATAETQNRQMLEDIKTQNEGLKEKYERAIESISADARQNKSYAEEAQTTVDRLQQEKNELQAQLTKCRVSERALKIKLDTIQSRQEADKAAIEARTNSYMLSLQTQATKQVEELKGRLDLVKSSIVLCLKNDFNECISCDVDFDEAFSVLQRKLQLFTADKRILADASKIRSELGISPSASLMDVIKEYEQQKVNAERAVEAERARTAAATRENCSMKALAEKNAQLAKLASEWENWARSMHSQISDLASPSAKSREIRNFLEEALLLSIGQRSTLRRIDLLREEKKILKRDLPIKSNHGLNFISLVNAFQFVNRIQCISGCVRNRGIF